MNILKSALAACFVGGFVYFLIVAYILFWPISETRATGVGAVVSVTRDPINLLIGFIAFVLTFLALKRWVFVAEKV